MLVTGMAVGIGTQAVTSQTASTKQREQAGSSKTF